MNEQQLAAGAELVAALRWSVEDEVRLRRLRAAYTEIAAACGWRLVEHERGGAWNEHHVLRCVTTEEVLAEFVEVDGDPDATERWWSGIGPLYEANGWVAPWWADERAQARNDAVRPPRPEGPLVLDAWWALEDFARKEFKAARALLDDHDHDELVALFGATLHHAVGSAFALKRHREHVERRYSEQLAEGGTTVVAVSHDSNGGGEASAVLDWSVVLEWTADDDPDEVDRRFEELGLINDESIFDDVERIADETWTPWPVPAPQLPEGLRAAIGRLGERVEEGHADLSYRGQAHPLVVAFGLVEQAVTD